LGPISSAAIRRWKWEWSFASAAVLGLCRGRLRFISPSRSIRPEGFAFFLATEKSQNNGFFKAGRRRFSPLEAATVRSEIEEF